MFKFCSLFSGSTGNSLFVETENSKILVDAGESAKKIVSALSLIGIEVTDIDAILVTHEHIDHVKSLGTLSKKYNIPVYANENTWNAMPEQQAKILEEKNIKVIKNYIGNFATSMDMAGMSISLMKLDEELKKYLFMPCETPFFTSH